MSRNLLKNYDILPKFKRMWRFLTGMGLLIAFLCVSIMTVSLSFKFHKNLTGLKIPRPLLKNDDTVLEFRRMWRFLTLARVLDIYFDVFI